MAVIVRAGDLRHRLMIQQRLITRGNQGGFSYSWGTLNTVWGSVEPIGENEQEQSNSLAANITHRIRIRSMSGLNASMRIKFGERVLNIASIRNIEERRIYQEILCTETEVIETADTVPGITNLVASYQTDELDLTTTQDITKTMPGNKLFFIDSVELICTELTGSVVTQPTITAGITGNLTKYLSRLTTQVNAENKRQAYNNLGANSGESALRLGISVPGAVSTGVYKGIILVQGILVG